MAPWLIAVLLAALLAALTGGLHLDGVADVFDALGGGRGDRARMLEIMRDSRIGAHGAAALTLLLIAKVAALAQVAERRDLLALLAFPTIARWLAALLVVFFPYVRAEGLGRAFNGEARARPGRGGDRHRGRRRRRARTGADPAGAGDARRSCWFSRSGCTGGSAG